MAEVASGWEFDKRIPLALVASIIMQTSVIVWWASKMEQRVGAMEARMAEVYTNGAPSMQVELARIAARMDAVTQRVDINAANISQVFGDGLRPRGGVMSYGKPD